MPLPLLPTWSVYHYDLEGHRTGSNYGLTKEKAEALAAAGKRSYARQDRDTGDRPVLDYAPRRTNARGAKRANPAITLAAGLFE